MKISRLENGIIQTVPQKGDLRELACQVKTLMEQKANEKQISLTVKAEKENIFAWFDEKWTREALMNLVDNAVKYTLSGGKVTFRSGSLQPLFQDRRPGYGDRHRRGRTAGDLPQVLPEPGRPFRGRGRVWACIWQEKLSGAREGISRFLPKKGREAFFFRISSQRKKRKCLQTVIFQKRSGDFFLLSCF